MALPVDTTRKPLILGFEPYMNSLREKASEISLLCLDIIGIIGCKTAFIEGYKTPNIYGKTIYSFIGGMFLKELASNNEKNQPSLLENGILLCDILAVLHGIIHARHSPVFSKRISYIAAIILHSLIISEKVLVQKEPKAPKWRQTDAWRYVTYAMTAIGILSQMNTKYVR